MPDLIKRRKKDEVERYTDTGTGSKPKTAATKPSGAPLHLNSNRTATSTRTTPKVEKPGLARSGGITRQADTGTGGEALKRRTQNQQDIRLDRARDEAAQRVETGKEQLRATRERLGQQTFEEKGYESRKERESRAPQVSTGKGSRASGKKEDTGSTSMTGKEYLNYVYEAKKRQQEQDVEAVRAIDSYKRNRYLVGLDVGQAEQELARLEDWLDKGVNTERRRWDLNAAYNDGGRDGETYQAALAQYGQAAAEAEETKAKIAQLKQDIEQAKSAQYYEKGVAELDNVKKYHYGAWKNIDTLAQRAMPETGEALPASENGTFDVDPNAIAQLSAEADKARAELRRLGYKDEDISKLVDYRLRQLNNERTAAALAQAQEFAKTHPFAASAASVATNIGSGLGVLDAAVQRLRNPDRPYDYNSESMLASNWTNAVRNQVSQDIVSSANDRGRSGAVGNFLYQTGMSMADSLVNMGLAAVGMPEALGLTVLGGSAATASMREAHERGLSDAQALGIGLFSGIAEYATERIGLDAFMETLTMKGARRQSVTRALLTNALAEGGEEVASDVVNFVADQIVAQDASEFRKNIESYKNLGFTDAEAVASALKDQLGDTALSFLGGALSGGVMGTGGHIVSGITNNHYNQLLVGAMTLEDSSPVKTAAVAVRELNHQISTEMMQKGLDEPTEAQAKQLQEAYSAFSEALQQADTQTQKLVEEQGKKAYRAEKQQYQADKKKIRQEIKANKKASPQIMARVNEALNSGSLQFSENATVQEAASLLARDRYAVNEATGKVLADPEAMRALNLSFPEGTNIPEQKRTARLALQSLIDSTKASTAEQLQLQAEAEAQAAEVEDQTDVAAETESADPAAVSAENAEQAAEVQEAVEQEAEDEEIDLADAELLTREEHEELLLKQNPNLTREQLDDEYEAMVSAHRNAEVRRDIQDRTGKMTMVGGRALSYRAFRSLAQQNAAAKGQTLEEDVIRRAFDTGAEETSEAVKKYEEERKADLEDTVKRINEASVLKNWGYTVRVSYDTEHDFVSKKVQENAFVSAKNKEIVFNGNRMDSGAMIMYVLGHEVTHKAAEVDKTLVKNIIDTFTELANDGKLNAQLTYKMRNIDAELEKLRKLYQMHEDERAAAQNRKPVTITLDDVREEFAADLMRDAFMQTKLYQEIVSKNADLAVKMRETLKRVLRALTGDGRKSRAVQKALQKIADQEDAALARITADDSTLNRDAEDVTADNLTAKQLEEVKDTHGDEMFSLGTMKQDLDNYMQDLRSSDLLKEGIMTEEELTGLYNSINKVMDYVELHQEEIERSESYRNMTAENRPFSPYKDNSDPHYKKALDFSTLCRKRLLTQAITERLQNALKRALTPVEQVKIRNMIKELQKEYKHISVACALCYVEAARLKSPKVINEFLKNRSDTIWMFYSLKDSTFKHDVYEARRAEWKEQHGLDRKATNDTIKKDKKLWKEFEAFNMALRKSFPKWLQQNNPERYEQLTASVAAAEDMDASEFLSAQSLARMRQNETTRDVYDAFITKVREATRSKAQETDVPYARGDVNKVSDALIKQMNEESGFRHQSWSDFQAMHLLDSIAAIIELSTRKAKMHTYTKVPDMVRFLGYTGMMINMSLIPSGQTGLDENDNLTWDPVEGFDYQEMLDLRKKFHATAGNIAIGISDEQILALMASPDIDYIIPYHTSGLNADMRNRMGIRKWQDYTKWQNEKGDDWEKKAPKLREWFDIKEALLAPDGVAYMAEASKKYLALCHERKLTPKFSQFLQKNSDGSYSLRDDAQNYWKLLIDRKMVDQYTGGIIQQKAVVPRFNEDTMLGILKNEVEGPAAREAREAEDYIVNKVLENGEGIVSKAERAQLENSARILRDAALRGAIENAAQELGISEDDRQFSIAYEAAASDSARSGLQQARDMLWDYQYEHLSGNNPVPFAVMEDIRDKTGWWRSPTDNKWRYWISDADATWNADTRDLASDTGEVFKLYDVIKHDRLFRDYPQLEDVEVMFYLPEGGSVHGEFLANRDQWTINLQANAELNDETFSTLLHEIQHAIQQIEEDQWNQVQGGSNTDVGYKQAFVVAYNDITNSGQDTSMFNGLSYKQAVRKIEQRIAKLYRNSSGFTDAERQRLVGDGMSEKDIRDWEKAERADRGKEDIRGAVQASAYEYYREAIGEVDARFTGQLYQMGRLIGDPDMAAEANLQDRVRYGEETRRGDYESVRDDILSFRRISRDLGWDGNPEHLHSSNYDLAESRRSSAEERQFSLTTPQSDATLEAGERGLVDSGEETHLGGSAQAVSGGKQTQTARPGEVQKGQRLAPVRTREEKAVVRVNGREYGWDVAKEKDYTELTRSFLNALPDFVATRAFVSADLSSFTVDGQRWGSASPARTLQDGTVLISNKTDTDMPGRHMAGHEALHASLRQGRVEAEEFVKVVRENIDLSSDAGANFLAVVVDNYLSGDFDTNDAGQSRRLFEEAAAFIAGNLAEQYVNNFRDALIDPDAVQSAWERTLPNTDTEASEESGASSVDRQYSLYNDTAILKESTVDKYLADYAAKSSPNYAQAYIAWMSPRAFLDLTTSRIGRLSVENESTDLDEERFAEASQYQPLQLHINHETGDVEGHEGRHRCVGLMRAGVRRVPVLLFDNSNKYSKETIPELTLQGQDFGSSRSYATRSVENLMPLSYANRDAIVKEFATKSTDQKMAEKYLDERTLQFSIDPNYAGSIDSWDRDGRPADETFTLGTTGDVLQALGAQERTIYMNAKKVSQIMVDHPNMTLDEIKRLPEVLENPTLILKSRGQNKQGHNTRVVVYGNLKDKNGAPVAVVFDLAPSESGVRVDDLYKVSSAYGKDDADTPKAIEKSEVLFANKKRAPHLLRQLGFKESSVRVPGLLSAQGSGAGYSSLGSINDAAGNVNTTGAPFGQVFDYKYSLDLDDLDHDPVMQAFLDAYNPNMTATQKKAFYASLDKQIDKAQKVYESALKQAEKHPTTASDVGSIAQRKNTMIAWVIARQKFGTIKPSGENYRDVSVPARTAPNNRVSKTAATVMGAEATPESRLKTIADAIVGGKLSYRPRTDPKAMIDARAKVARGFQEARIDWAKSVAKGQVNKDLVAMGAVLLNNAGNSNASAEEYIDILTDYSDLLRRAGQALQAAKLLKRLSPEAQLYTAQRQVDKINEELKRKGIDPNKFKGVTIDQDLIDRYRKAKTDEERKKIMKLIIENIAGQIPASGMDKFTAWRYLAMLGNFRTQVRNIAGNASMQFMRLLKADTAGLTEALIQRAGGNIDRAQSVFRDKETWKAAKEEFSEVRDIILAGGKYDERRAFAREVEEARKIFKFKPLEKYRKLTGDVMDWGDAIFCSFTYRDALARYIKANGTTWSKASEELKDKAREFAIREAAEATYRDDNSFSNLIVGLRVHNPDNAAKKAMSVAVEGVLPFRKTPANILARTIEYSPVGLVYGAYNAAATRFGRKNVTGTDIVNQLAKGFSGTALIALGMMLAAKGMLVGKEPEDDKEKEEWKREGHQAYSLEIGGTSFTLDWMAPTCVPFFLGANFHDAFLEQGVTLETALDSLRTISDPILEMSMLQGIQNLIDNAANYGDDSALVRLTTDAAWNFVTQVVPTMLGQAERAFFDDNKRMTTYIDKNSKMPTEWQYKAGKASAKVPGVDYAQMVYTDAWGRMQTDVDSPTLHAVLQFFSPGYVSKIETTPMEEELLRLYKATGEKKVLISSADKTISYTWEDVKGEKHQEKMNLTADEYFTYNTTRGRLAYSLMTEITNSQAYKNMSDSEKVKCVEYAYDYATQVGKGAVAKNFQAESWVDNAADAQKIGLSTSEFIAARAKYGTSYFTGKEYEGLKDAVKDGIKMEDYIKMHANVEKHFFSSYTQAEVKDYLQSADIPEDQKAVLWSQTLTSDAREKYDAAIEAGIKPEDYYNMRMKVDADGSGSVTQAEAQAYLDSTSLSRAEKSTLWTLINKSWKKNPYA